jgi:hypothetical protein
VDIKPGDFLVVSGKDYPIKSVAEWTGTGMNSRGFARRATLSPTTKRTKKGEPTAHLTSGLSCTPLDPVDPETRRRLALETPVELLQTFLADSTGFVHLVLEDIKR